MADKEMLELILEGMNRMEERLTRKIEESETRTKIFVENSVSKRIDALFDGYKLTHEKQWELERKTEALQSQIDELQARLARLEERSA